MDGQRLRRNTKVLWAMVVLAIVYSGTIYYWFGSVSRDWLVGSLGVLLGLYICSHPAANAVDLIFFERGAIRRFTKQPAWLGWLALNLLVLLAGWTVILIGTTYLTGRIV